LHRAHTSGFCSDSYLCFADCQFRFSHLGAVVAQRGVALGRCVLRPWHLEMTWRRKFANSFKRAGWRVAPCGPGPRPARWPAVVPVARLPEIHVGAPPRDGVRGPALRRQAWRARGHDRQRRRLAGLDAAASTRPRRERAAQCGSGRGRRQHRFAGPEGVSASR